MLRKLTTIIINLTIGFAIGQEVLIESKSPIRTFDLLNDTIYYSNEHFINGSTGSEIFKKFYTGGYVIDMDLTNDEIITLANNYKKETGTVRIFDLKKDKYSLVYNIKYPSPMLAFSSFPTKEDNKAIIISFNDGNLNWYNSKGVLLKNFGKYDKVRGIKLENNQIYFCSDNGNLYIIKEGMPTLVFSLTSNSKILGFELTDNYIYAYNDIGNVVCFNRTTKELREYPVTKSIITDIIVAGSQLLIISDWDGNLIYFDINLHKKNLEFRAHKKRILKLKLLNNNIFISSGQDGLLKEWELNDL